MQAAYINRISALLVVAAAGLTAALPAAAATTTVNPLRPVSATNAQADPSHGFGVLVAGDAALAGGESETSIAVGGKLTFGGYQVSDKDTGSAQYFTSGDTAGTSLVAGSVDFSKSTGLLQVTQNNYAKLGGSYTVTPNGGVTAVSAPPAAASIAINTAQSASSIKAPSGFDLPSLFKTYRTTSTQLAALPNTVSIKDQNGQNPWNGTDSNVSIAFKPGQNVLNLTAAQLAKIQAVNPSGVALGANAWLIINITDQGNVNLRGATNAFQNSPTHVLWNFTTAGTIGLDSGRQFSGSLYAPNARLIDDDGQNIEGDVAVQSLQQGSAEIHNVHFANTVQLTTTTTPSSGSTTPSSSTTTPSKSTSTTPKSTSTATSSPAAAVATPGSSPSPTASPAVTNTSNGSSLAFTGVDIALLAALTATLIGAGTALVLRARRRNSQ
jgi:choice-of-anchor A domain-containing protein